MNLNNFELSVQAREAVGSKSARKTRKEGKVPVNFYGKDFNFSGYIDLRELERAVKSKTLFNMFSYANIEGKKHLVFAKVLQRDSVTENILHVDFQVVDTSKKFKMRVPISYLNQDICEDIKLGAVLNIVKSSIVLRAKAENMPAYLECDLKNAKAKMPIRLSSVKIPENVELIGVKLTDTIASISSLRIKGSDAVSSENTEA